MTLAIDNLKPEEAADVLTRAASLVLPNPRLDSLQPSLADERAAVVIEQLKEFIGKKKPAEAVIDEVRAILLHRLTDPYLTADKLPDVKARLAKRGLLSDRDLNLIYPEGFERIHQYLQIREHHIVEAIRSPDVVQRLQPTDFGLEQERFPHMALYVKKIAPSKKPPFSLLVHCVQQSTSLVVSCAWRIYREDIHRPDDESPLALLKAFVRTFGTMFTVENSGPEQFVLYQVYPKLNESGPPNVSIIDQEGKQFVKCWFARGGQFHVVEVAFAYVIDLGAYVPTQIKYGHPIMFHTGDLEGKRVRGSAVIDLQLD